MNSLVDVILAPPVVAPTAFAVTDHGSLDRSQRAARTSANARLREVPAPRVRCSSQKSVSPSAVVALASVVAPTAFLAKGAASTSRRSEKSKLRRTVRVAVRAGTDDDAALMAEAAQLRAEVAALEADKEKAKAKEQERLFGVFDVDNSGAIDLEELQRGLKLFWGVDVEEEMVKKLMKSQDKNSDGVLQKEEFDLAVMERNYGKLKAEERAVQEVVMKEKSKELAGQEEKEAEERALAEYKASLPIANDDNGIFARFGSILGYFLPLIDALRYSQAAVTYAPFLKGFILVFLELFRVLSVIPYGFGPLLLFIGLQSAANNVQLPTLLRFNCRQSVLLTLSLFFPGIIGGLVNILYGGLQGTTDEWGQWQQGVVPLAITEPCSALIFFTIFGCVMYSIASSLAGITPDLIPFVSAESGRTMAQTRDGSEDPGGNDQAK